MTKRAYIVLVLGLVLVALAPPSNAEVLESKRRVTADTVTSIQNSDNLPFATVVDDNTNWWDSGNAQWVVNQTGLYHLQAIVTFDQDNIDGFPPSVRYDHQVYAWINDVYDTDLFLAIYANKGDGSTVLQQRLEGENTYRLEPNDTVAVRIQTRIYPYSVVESAITGGIYAMTEGSLRLISS